MIQIKNLTKNYGTTTVIENLNLSINTGEVYALLGKNGVGKSTLINMILDLIVIDNGTIHLFNKSHTDINKDIKKKIGVLSEDIGVIEELNAYEFLRFIGKIYELSPETIEKRINDLFSYFFENESDIKKNIKEYSTGMKKKIAFCASIIHTPELLILDEPFSGLDPFVANQMVNFLKKYQREDRVIFVSSHDLNYVEKIATHIGVLDNKNLVFNSSIQEFTENGEKELDSALLKIIKPNDNELENIDWV